LVLSVLGPESQIYPADAEVRYGLLPAQMWNSVPGSILVSMLFPGTFVLAAAEFLWCTWWTRTARAN
jgi:hypothetical protein